MHSPQRQYMIRYIRLMHQHLRQVESLTKEEREKVIAISVACILGMSGVEFNEQDGDAIASLIKSPTIEESYRER